MNTKTNRLTAGRTLIAAAVGAVADPQAEGRFED